MLDKELRKALPAKKLSNKFFKAMCGIISVKFSHPRLSDPSQLLIAIVWHLEDVNDWKEKAFFSFKCESVLWIIGQISMKLEFMRPAIKNSDVTRRARKEKKIS